MDWISKQEQDLTDRFRCVAFPASNGGGISIFDLATLLSAVTKGTDSASTVATVR